MTNEIVLGSGKLYVAAFTAGSTLSALSTYCTTTNQLGLIQGGAAIEYKPTTYEVKDDLCMVYKRFITSEEATLKSGVLTWNTETLHNFIGNASYAEASGTGIKTFKLGGNGAREMDEWIVVFEHTKKDGTIVRIGMVATNDAGLALSFQPDKETVVDAEFKAITNDSTGCLLIVEETPAPTPPTGH